MVRKIILTAGEFNKKGKFEQICGGDIYEYYIEFDDGSTKGHCSVNSIQDYIERVTKEHKELQNRSDY